MRIIFDENQKIRISFKMQLKTFESFVPWPKTKYLRYKTRKMLSECRKIVSDSRSVVATPSIASTASTAPGTTSSTASTMGSKQQPRGLRDTGPIAGKPSGTGEVLSVQLRTKVDVQSTALVDVVGLQNKQKKLQSNCSSN